MGRKKERPSTRPVDWEGLPKNPTNKESDRQATLAPGYAGPNPIEFPTIGEKEGSAIVDHQPFPACIGLAPDPYSNNQAVFNDSLCISFLSTLHKLLLDQGRVSDIVQTLAGIREESSRRTSNPASERSLRRQLAESANQWASQKFGPSAPKIDEGSTSRLFTMLQALYNFTGRVHDVMKRVCGPSRFYRPWFKKYPLVCPQGNCEVEFDNASDVADHLQQKHTNLPHDLEYLQFSCSICDAPVFYAEKEIRAHLKTHSLSMTRYAYTKLTNTKDLFKAPSKDYWASAEEDKLFVNLPNAPAPITSSSPSSTLTRNPAKGRPNGSCKTLAPEDATPPSDPLSDLLATAKDETGGSNYETEQELERLLVNPAHSMDHAPHFNVGTTLTIPAPSSSAPPAGPGLWGPVQSQDAPDIHAPLGTIPGVPTSLGLHTETGPLPPPPATSQSARGPDPTELNSLNASAPGPIHYGVTNQTSPPFTLGGPLNSNLASYPAIPSHNVPPSHMGATSMAINSLALPSEPASMAVPASSGPHVLYYGRSHGPPVPPLPITNTNLASTQQAHWAKINGAYTQVPVPQQPVSLPFCPSSGPTTIMTQMHPFTGGQTPFMTYSLINPMHPAQGPSVQPGLAAASAPPVALATTASMTTTSVPASAGNPAVGATDSSKPPEHQNPRLEDPAIIRTSTHVTKPEAPPPKSIPRNPYVYKPRSSIASSGGPPPTTTTQSPNTFGVKEDDILSICCSNDLDSAPEDYAIPPTEQLPCPNEQEDISLELMEKKRATYFSDYPVINKNPSVTHSLSIHKRRDNPIACVKNLDPEFKSLYEQVQTKIKQTKNDKKPTILAFVSPLEEHLLHYLPLRVKKTVVPEEFRPLKYTLKPSYINDSHLISLGEAVYGRVKNGLKTILLLGGWSNFIKDYEINDQQVMLAQYISLVLTICLRRLQPGQSDLLELIILGPVPQGTSNNLIKAPNYSLSLARRLTMVETYSIPWSFFNPCGLMGEIFAFNQSHPSHTFTLFDPVVRVITQNFAHILEVGLSKLISLIFLGNRPDGTWKTNFRNNPQHLPNHLEIYDCRLDKQGLLIHHHGIIPTTVPITDPGDDHSGMSPHSQLGEPDHTSDSHVGLPGLNTLDPMEIDDEENDHCQTTLPDLRTRIKNRGGTRSPSQTSSRSISPAYASPSNPGDGTTLSLEREESLHSRSDASEIRVNRSQLGLLRARRQSHAASYSEDSDTSRERQPKYPRLHRNRDSMPQMRTTPHYIAPPNSRPGTISPRSPQRSRERGRERQRDPVHFPKHRPNLRFNDHYSPPSPPRDQSYGHFRPQPLLEAEFPPWEPPYQFRNRRGRSPNRILGIPSHERSYRPAIRPRSKSQVDFSRNRPDLRPHVRPKQWRPYRGRGRPQNF